MILIKTFMDTYNQLILPSCIWILITIGRHGNMDQNQGQWYMWNLNAT